jgi:hypothetical protein
MPKALSEYAWPDLLRLQPLVHACKSARYAIIDRRYLATRLPDDLLVPVRRAVQGKDVLITIAFNDPDLIDWQLRLCFKFLPPRLHLIADNSNDAGAASNISKIAAAHGAFYLKLPDNPWTSKGNGSRSHGAAMNFIWQHVVRPGAPRAFGFLDHDLFPTAPDDPFALLNQHDWYGDFRFANVRWFLWAGYCFFRFDAVRGQPLDFGLDWFAGLDTGGANFEVLYKNFDRSRLPQRTIREIAAFEGISTSQACFEWRGTWLHETGFGDDRSMRTEKRAALAALLKPLMD